MQKVRALPITFGLPLLLGRWPICYLCEFPFETGKGIGAFQASISAFQLYFSAAAILHSHEAEWGSYTLGKAEVYSHH